MKKTWKCICFCLITGLTVINVISVYFRISEGKPLYMRVLKNMPCVPPLINHHTGTNISLTVQDWSTLNNLSQHLQNGGNYKPMDCEPNEKVAIIIPYRNREDNLKVFLSYIHPFLQRQRLQYGIYVIEMQGRSAFNRGALMNIGFVEASKQSDQNCFIFHDVDLLPLTDQINYTCGPNPKHLAVAIDQYDYQLPYPTYFGGVNVFTKQQYKTINGFANIYKGWGREDDDLYLRTTHANFNISRPAVSVGRYRSLGHKKARIRRENFRLFKKAHRRFFKDGLTSLTYTVTQIQLRPLYTWIYVSIAE